MMWWRDLSGESKASKGGAGTADKPYGVAALLTNWKHMTDQIYNNVSNERLGDGSGAPTTHMAEGNNIVPRIRTRESRPSLACSPRSASSG